MMVHDQLATAQAAATAQAWPQALRALLAIWRDYPSAVLATAVEDVSVRAMAEIPEPIAQTAGSHNAIWFTRAKTGDPVVLGQLCTTLRKTRRANDLLHRIELLLPHGPDPRIAMAVCDVLAHATYPVLQIDLKPFWSRLFSWLPELGDPRVLARARGFGEAWIDHRDVDREALLARLDDTMPALVAAYPEREPLDETDRATCLAITQIARHLGADDDHRHEAALLAAIYAAPDADEPRAVYADWLQQRGHPRGEFIALQLAKTHTKPSPAHAARERALFHTFGAEWTAPLERAELERGFLAGSRETEMLGADPRLATLTRAWSVPEADGQFGALRTLDKIGDRQIAHLATLNTPLPVEHLGWEPAFFEEGDPLREAAIDAWSQIHVLPRLRSLAILYTKSTYGYGDDPILTVPDLERVLAAPCLRQLRSFALRYPLTELALVIATFTRYPFETIRITTARRYEEVGRATLSRDPRGKFGQLELELHRHADFAHDVVEALGTLVPDQLTPDHHRRWHAAERGTRARRSIRARSRAPARARRLLVQVVTYGAVSSALRQPAPVQLCMAATSADNLDSKAGDAVTAVFVS